MRFNLIIFFCVISLSASAQFWKHISFKKKHIVLPALQPARSHSLTSTSDGLKLNDLQVAPAAFEPCEFTLENRCAYVMEQAKHNMRFRIYSDASYNFSDLAHLYIKLHRLSEAKWYLLQSNNIARQENDAPHTISNLVSLAEIKIELGDTASAKADLIEARDMAYSRGMQAEMADIEKRILLLAQNTTTPVKADMKYAETAGGEKKTL
jgi:hypothetical protein